VADQRIERKYDAHADGTEGFGVSFAPLSCRAPRGRRWHRRHTRIKRKETALVLPHGFGTHVRCCFGLSLRVFDVRLSLGLVSYAALDRLDHHLGLGSGVDHRLDAGAYLVAPVGIPRRVKGMRPAESRVAQRLQEFARDRRTAQSRSHGPIVQRHRDVELQEPAAVSACSTTA